MSDPACKTCILLRTPNGKLCPGVDQNRTPPDRMECYIGPNEQRKRYYYPSQLQALGITDEEHDQQ